jgi:tricorn protease interacting factor F2/3
MANVKPIHYTVHLEPNLNSFKVDGTTGITVKAETPVGKVTVNAHELAIWKCQVELNGKQQDCPFSFYPKKQELVIDLPEMMSDISLKIEHMGLINTQLVGFYRSKYEKDEKEKYIAVTQFEEEHARQAFPCFDHPAYKTTFDIEYVIEKDLSGIANTRITEEIELEDGRKLVKFQTTPKMCTYLLFFGVGEFEYIESQSKDVLYRIATTPGKTQYAKYSLDFGRKSIEYGEEYTGIKYPIDKMDQIAVSDFAFGAMENYGAITYRENLLLVYPGITSKAGLERIAEVIAHEVAHQWFGNLVSPLDWKYIWLNESFATLFGYAITDHYHPEWEIWEQFLVGEVDGAFERDSLIETFPIELPGKDEKTKITAATAPIIYSKGGAILQMISGYLGEDKFRKGINHFLDKYKFECAESTAYWKGIEEATGEPIADMMKTWVYQPGYPLIEVRKTGGNQLTLTQRRFSYLPNTSTDIWMIPITISFYRGNEFLETKRFVFKEQTMAIDLPNEVTSYKLNKDQTGFYKVKYEKNNLDALGQLVKQKILSPRDRYGLHNDLYAFVRSTDYSIDDYLDFMEYYTEEDDYLPLVAMSTNLVHAFRVVESRRERISSIGFKAFYEVLKQIGYEPREGEPHKVTNLRSTLLIASYVFNDEGVLEFGIQKFRDYLDGKEVHPDILASIMRIGAAKTPSSYPTLTKKLEDADTPEPEIINILCAIASFEDRELMLEALDYTIESVPSRNKIYPIAFASQNLAIIDDLWDWFKKNREELEKLHEMHFESVIANILSLAGLNRFEEVKSYFTDYMKEKDLAKDTIKMTLERLEINARLRAS